MSSSESLSSGRRINSLGYTMGCSPQHQFQQLRDKQAPRTKSPPLFRWECEACSCTKVTPRSLWKGENDFLPSTTPAFPCTPV